MKKETKDKKHDRLLLFLVVIGFMIILFIVFVFQPQHKDPCLVNPEREGCVCEETRIVQSQVYSSSSVLSSEKHTNNNKMCTSYNYTLLDKSNNSSNEGTITEITICDTCFGFCETHTLTNYTIKTLSCIRAHSPKDECEKGNENYIVSFDYDKINCSEYDEKGIKTECSYALYVDKNNEIKNAQCCPEVICRHKTLDEYSCEELKKHIEENDLYCHNDGVWNSEFDWLNQPCGLSYMSPNNQLEVRLKMELYYFKKCEVLK